MKKYSETSTQAPPAVTKFSDSVFYYALGAGTFSNTPVPADAGYVEITASQFVAVSPATVAGAPGSSPSATAGLQSVVFSPTILSTTATGLPNTAQVFTAVFNIDGVTVTWFDSGSNIQTFGTLIGSINSTISGKGTASVAGGVLIITSATTGVGSKVRIQNAPVISATPTPTSTATVTPTVSKTITLTPSVTTSVTTTPGSTVTPSVTPSVTDSPGLTVTPSVTATATVTVTPTPTHTLTPSVTHTIATSPAVTPTISGTPSVTPTVTLSITITPTISVTPTQVGSGVFFAIPTFVDFNAPVDGVLSSSNTEVVLTTVKQLAPSTTVIGVYAPTSNTIVSLAFYK